MDQKKKLILSYSKLKTYECPKKYHYQYVQRMPKRDNARHSLPGRALQKLFELYVNSKKWQEGSTWLYANAQKVFYLEYKRQEQTTVFKKDETYEDVLMEVVDMIPACYDLFIKKGWNQGQIFSEIRFKTSLTGTIDLIGDIDFLIKTPKETVIMDFKSTSKGLDGVDKEQLLIYNHLYKANNAGKYPDNTYFFLCRDNQLVRVKIVQEEMDGLITKMTTAGNDILAGKWQKAPSKANCQWCPYKKTCWSPNRSPW